ncbi:12109_t:CDS:1, partial [Ambispora gerdemannii]
MATVEKTERELNDAKVQLEKAEKALEEFVKGGDGQWLEVLKGRLRGEGGTAAQREEWKAEKNELAEEKKRLEAEVTRWSVEVTEWGAKLRELDTRP